MSVLSLKCLKKPIAFIIFMLIGFSSYSQTFDAHWWNGTGYLMDFRTTPPTVSCDLTSDGAFEATSSWSDPVTGDLLFYADLGTVRDNNGVLYSNGSGINTNATRTQMAVVMPVPGTNLNQVYLLHGDGSDESNGGTAYYSIIDVTTKTVISKNNLLQNNTTEAFYGTNNGALCGAWVATIANNVGTCTSNCSASVKLWQVDASNFLSPARANNPDVSIDLPVNILRRGERASIRFSKQNDRIGIAVEGSGIFYASFDSTTGAIGTWTHVPRTTINNTTTGYSLEFSPDGSKLFYAHDNSTSSNSVGWRSPLYMHVIGSNTSVEIEDETLGSWAGVQLGPDDKLYLTDNNHSDIYYLNNPDTVTSAADASFGFLDISTYATCGVSDRQGYNFTQQVVFFSSCLEDTDGDGLYDETDIDDDNDGILDSIESEGDIDSDGIPNLLDLDSDGDGIPDNVEAQISQNYIAPILGVNADTDNNGLNDAYETTPGAGNGLVPVNTDGLDNPDYLDLDSDNADGDDTNEAGLTLSNSDSDGDGLDDAIDTSTDYSDPAGTIDNPISGAIQLPDANGDVNSGGDLDFRDPLVPNVDPNDIDGDGILNGDDFDDDNDGILDTQELCGTNPVTSGPTNSTIVVTIITDNYPGETTWTLDAPSGQIASGGPYPNTGTTYTQTINTSETGIFTFEILDSFGDGICCTYGSGSYNVELNGNSVATGGDFGSSESTDFEITPVTVDAFSCLTDDPNGDADNDLILNYLDADFATANGSVLNSNGVVAILDLDGDGIINSMDLDSDGDGCPDALEGDAPFSQISYSDLSSSNSILGSIDTEGVPSLASGGQSPGISQDNTQQIDECSTCDTNNPLFLDSDGDSIGNDCDLDDDNDGILDSDEAGFSVLWVTQGTANTEEQNTIDKLTALGYAVTVVDDGDSEDANNYDVTFLFERVNSSTAFSNIANLATTVNGVITSENALHDEILGGVTGGNSGTQYVTITDNSHPITIGLSLGNYDIGDANFYGNGITSGTTLGTNLNNGEAAIVVWEAGEPLETGTAPGRRVIVPHTRGFNTAGEDLLVKAIIWSSQTDTDGDGVSDDLDLDSDNDGIYDAVEAGHDQVHTLGRLAGNVGLDGIPDSVQASGQEDSGTVNYTVQNSDGSGDNDYVSLDSDGDGCNDVQEAGYTESLTVPNELAGTGYDAATGIVTGNTDGYTAPLDGDGSLEYDYREAGIAPSISSQPIDAQTCPGCNATFTVTASNTNTYQWQFFNGTTWVNLTDTGIYSNTATATLTITSPTTSNNGDQYRVVVSNSSFSCITETSNTVILSISVSKVITNRRITYRVKKN
ncbi:hypothetical protein [uncultured Croceitalea sp.]|uniref:hypothetical protein n=1 Tax=uncultured Croceitalea sp. TaxID=1798908 RepID=UPI003305926F